MSKAPRKPAARKKAAQKPAARKAPAKRAAPKKTAPKKTAAKKAAAPKKAAPNRSASKRPTTRKSAAGKTTGRTQTAKRAAERVPQHAPQRRRLPGDMTPEAFLERLIRVDHAGEYGAERIYSGQLAVLGDSDKGPILEHMAEQELVHKETFEKMIVERRVRPTALLPLWHVFGYAMGAGTALMGERAAMACTVAVEEVIDEHYAAQQEKLGPDEAELWEVIERFRLEELEHRDIGLANEAELTPGYRVLHGAIKRITKTAIWLSERV